MLRFNSFCAAALANPLFFVFNFGQPIDHLPGCAFRSRPISYRDAYRFLWRSPDPFFHGHLRFNDRADEDYQTMNCTHPLSLLTWPRMKLESWRFETMILNRLQISEWRRLCAAIRLRRDRSASGLLF